MNIILNMKAISFYLHDDTPVYALLMCSCLTATAIILDYGSEYEENMENGSIDS